MKPRKQVLRGFIPLGGIQRIEVPSQPVAPMETPAERKQREWRESCEKETRRVQAARAARIEAERKARLQQQAEDIRRRAAEDRQQALARLDLLDSLIDAAMDRYGLTPAERDRVNQILLDSGHVTEERAVIESIRIAAEKEQAGQAKLAEIRSLCTDDEWKRLQDVLLRQRHNFSDDDVQRGIAAEVIYDRLFG
jgi:hypothetical protein